jgi:hypothetical protein
MCNLIDNFNDGDFLYGRQDYRKLFLSLLRKKFKPCPHCQTSPTDCLPIPHPVTADDFNNQIIERLLQLKLKNTPWPDTLPDDLRPRFHDADLGAAYYKQVFIEAMPKNTNATRKLKAQTDEDILRDVILAQACKANFYNQTSQEIKIHFIVENELLHATLGFTNNMTYFKAFTAKELRFAYKHWLDLADKVIFYNTSGKKIPPPWEDTNSPLFSFWSRLRDGNTKELFNQKLPAAAPSVPPLPPMYNSAAAPSTKVSMTPISPERPVKIPHPNVPPETPRNLKRRRLF